MNLRTIGRLTLCGLVGASLSCGGDDATGTHGPGHPLRVLFMGNSLTYVNDLPAMVKAIAEAAGESIETSTVAYGNYSIEDHWNSGSAREMVRSGDYDVVIMQQGPSALPESRTNLRQWGETWAAEIRRHGGRPGFYAVWPESYRQHVFGDVSDTYRLAAADVDALFFPAGDTWLATWSEKPDAPLYGPDGFHPAVAGTYAAAVVIVSILTERSATSLPQDFAMPSVVEERLDSGVAETIRRAAESVINRFRAVVPQ